MTQQTETTDLFGPSSSESKSIDFGEINIANLRGELSVLAEEVERELELLKASQEVSEEMLDSVVSI